MQNNANSHGADNAAARPLTEILACSPEASTLLNQSSECIAFEVGETIFRQCETCRGLYLVVSGDLQRKTEWKQSRITLGMVRAGELLELSAALGDGKHTCTLTAKTSGILMLLPIQALREAFSAFPPLRVHLLEELAREVSRSYAAGMAIHMDSMRSGHRRVASAEGTVNNGGPSHR
ncbi:MAG TPA: Crp/Fnr family transcriptional regulator [Terracidiphilus sp.]|nr:Crp/Fnr family transcriptional regulator [Terracidiphilus sp.]